jgi:hypothetical protein
MELEVGSLRKTQIFEAAPTLARAFQNEPFEKYVFPDDKARAQRSPAHFLHSCDKVSFTVRS